MFKFNFKKKKTGEVIAPAHYNQLPNQHQHDYETTEETVTHEVTDLDEEDQSYALASLALADFSDLSGSGTTSTEENKQESNDFGGGSGGGGGAEGDFTPETDTKGEESKEDNLSTGDSPIVTDDVPEDVTNSGSDSTSDVAETVTSETSSDL